MRESFEKIYSENVWVHGSGEGSLPIHNQGYTAFLEAFLKEKGIQSVVDMGCGDWQFSRYVSWGPAQYNGYDVVPSVIARNQENYSKPGVAFHLYSGDPEELPAADLLIAKDVLQHWSNQSVQRFLPILSRYKFVLLTNCVNPRGETLNTDIVDGDYRYLDLRLPPFSLQATEVYSFKNHQNFFESLFRKPRWLKKVLLIQQS